VLWLSPSPGHSCASYKNKFFSALLLLILNATETTEIPIAAVSTMFRVQPTFLELQQLIAGAIWERNQEVLNFMMTTFGVSPNQIES
jgi:hypothetical protein